MTIRTHLLIALACCAVACAGPAGDAGAAGPSGAAGASSLIRQDPVAAGADCAAGGTKVSSGVDDDGDGVLSDAEIDATTFVCSAGEDAGEGKGEGEGEGEGEEATIACVGDFAVQNSLDLVALEQCDSVSGDLDVSGAFPSLAPLSSITSVGGALALRNLTATSITDIAGLTTLGAAFDVQNCVNLTSLAGVSFSSVTTLTIVDNDLVASLDGLQTIHGASSINIGSNPSLTTLAGLGPLTAPLPELLLINGNTNLTSLGNLGTLDADGAHVDISENSLLTSLSGFELTGTLSFLRIAGNASLSDISSLASVTSVEGEVVVVNNPALSTCAVLALLNGLPVPPPIPLVQNNLDDTPCP